MTITNEILQEVVQHLETLSDTLSEFEFDTQMHRDYLSTIALIAKVQSLRESMGGQR